MDKTTIWLVVGFMGQMFFSARFFLQWVYSEIKKRSMIPVGFWYFSLLGGATLLAYAIYREDPVFIVGQGAGLIIYSRNLILIKRRTSEEKEII
ncbi:MAG: hypothetical protein CFH32_00732 [Alphaproteobacteria bacterium MarineAlpha9_Bin2]|nr:MAG: hypothetical protein CFH31_00138 [Alphaproteobacteria bacterium MarineAlpha9_Bin1]PPR30424.1 MAG: hypothetical protein CFH32_00732 [Alphaproteobacteria bacterium MarineAlpha9_Bin2]